MTSSNPLSSMHLEDLDPTMRTGFNSPRPNTHIIRSGDGLLPKSYYLTSMDNYGLWAYKMKNILKRDGLFTWCSQAPSIFATTMEDKGREFALSSLISNAKGNVLRLIYRCADPHQLWQYLKERYEVDKNPKKVHLIEKLFSTKKMGSMNMNEYLIEMKETANFLEDANVPLLEDVVVWYILKNLPKEHDILKQMILCDSFPIYTKLELHVLSKEMSRRVQKTYEKESEALVATHMSTCQTFGRS